MNLEYVLESCMHFSDLIISKNLFLNIKTVKMSYVQINVQKLIFFVVSLVDNSYVLCQTILRSVRFGDVGQIDFSDRAAVVHLWLLVATQPTVKQNEKHLLNKT